MAIANGSWQETANKPRLINGYALWLQGGLITILTVVLYATTLADLANDWWTDPSLSQGLLIPPLAIWIAWTRRDLTLAHPVNQDTSTLRCQPRINISCFQAARTSDQRGRKWSRSDRAHAQMRSPPSA